MKGKQNTEILAETGEAAAVTAEPDAPQDCAEAAPAPAPECRWAPRSRKSIRDEEALQKELARCNTLKRRAEDTLAGLAGEKKRALKLIHDGNGWADGLLRDTLRKIEDEQLKFEAFKELAAQAQSNLDSFRAGVEAYAPERARIQDALAALAGARLEIDHELQKRLREALAMLQVREETIAFMRKQAAAIELQCDFEAGVPASLREVLSLDIVSASKAWNAKFLGEGENLKAYVVCDENFEPKETLARKAIYHFGDTVFLLEDEALEFLRNDRPKAGGSGWETLPPTLMTAEDFAAVQAESGRTGPLLKYILQQKHSELEQKRRQAYLEERRGTPVPNVHLHFAG
jgi:hypothetical protein